MNFMGFFKELFSKSQNKPHRRLIKDVKSGEKIIIEWNRISGGVGYVECINNDPETKTIFLQVKWNNYKEINCNQFEQLVLSYRDSKLKNFHLLNSTNEAQNDSELRALCKKLKEAVNKEEFEKAKKLQDKINKIVE